MSGSSTGIEGRGGRRRDRLIEERIHDPYRNLAAPPQPAHCLDCGASYQQGRWQWREGPEGSHESLCPACRRVRDRVPAGIFVLSGPFFVAHRAEILRLVHHRVEAEQRFHPLKRIMSIEDAPDRVTVNFTDAHLPQGVGHAIERAYEGDLEVQFTDNAGLVRAYWSRP